MNLDISQCSVLNAQVSTKACRLLILTKKFKDTNKMIFKQSKKIRYSVMLPKSKGHTYNYMCNIYVHSETWMI